MDDRRHLEPSHVEEKLKEGEEGERHIHLVIKIKIIIIH